MRSTDSSWVVVVAVRLVFILFVVSISIAFPADAARAFCFNDDEQVNVAGDSLNAGSSARGVKASVSTPTNDAECGIVRSIYVAPPGSNDFAEVALYEQWSDDLPHPAVAWNGDAGYDDWHAGYTVDEGILYALRIDDANNNYNWGAYFTGSFLHATGVLPFNKGVPATNGESDHPDDPGFAHFDGLGWCLAIGCNNYNAFNISCFFDDDPTAHFDRLGTNEQKVINGQTASGCAGAT